MTRIPSPPCSPQGVVLGWLGLLLLMGGGALGADPVMRPSPTLATAVTELKQLAQEMQEDQEKMVALQNEIGQLQLLGKDAEAKIRGLQDQVVALADRVKQLGERYSQVLAMAQKLKKDLEWSATWNYVLGGTALVAILVAVGEGLALAAR